MNEADFSEKRTGELLPIAGGLTAFKPHPLPPVLEPDWELVCLVESASRALATLAGAARTLPNPHLLLRPFIRREAVLSSRIEGTQASLSDLLLYEAQGDLFHGPPEDWHPANDVLEVSNYVRALEASIGALEQLPISLRLIRNAHAILLSGTRGEDKLPGEFRKIQVHIGPRNTTAADARYVPPPPGGPLTECLDAFEKYLHAPSQLPHLIRYALIHYQFEAIHPFMDGNGRIGRLLFSLLMVSEGLLPQPLLYLSAYFDRNRQEYYDRLLRVSTNGEWGSWIRFVLVGVAEQAGDAVQRSKRLLDLREEYRRQLAGPRASSLSSALVDLLFHSPILTITRAADGLRVSHQAAASHVEKLVALGILREITGRSRKRIYLAHAILAAVDDANPPAPVIE